MSNDARFQDAREKPLRLRAFEPEDLKILASILQDSVLSVGDISYQNNRLGLMVSRVRREVRVPAPERVRSVLIIENVQSVRANGIERDEEDVVLSLLTMEFEASGGSGGQIRLIFAGDGEILLSVEALEVVLRDVAQPHLAVSGKLPDHSL